MLLKRYPVTPCLGNDIIWVKSTHQANVSRHSLSVLYRSVSLSCTLCFIAGVSTPPLATEEGSAEKSIKKVCLAISEIPCDVPMEDLRQVFRVSSHYIGRNIGVFFFNFKNSTLDFLLP